MTKKDLEARVEELEGLLEKARREVDAWKARYKKDMADMRREVVRTRSGRVDKVEDLGKIEDL